MGLDLQKRASARSGVAIADVWVGGGVSTRQDFVDADGTGASVTNDNVFLTTLKDPIGSNFGVMSPKIVSAG